MPSYYFGKCRNVENVDIIENNNLIKAKCQYYPGINICKIEKANKLLLTGKFKYDSMKSAPLW